jgi:hypothetical protein
LLWGYAGATYLINVRHTMLTKINDGDR